MARETLDYDPLTGVTTFFDFDEMTGDIIIQKEQDVDSILRWTKFLRNTGACDTTSAKRESWRLYAVIPPLVEYQMVKAGLNPWSSDDADLRKVRRYIDEHYPDLKTTDMKDG
jgi:hypothetical protein